MSTDPLATCVASKITAMLARLEKQLLQLGQEQLILNESLAAANDQSLDRTDIAELRELMSKVSAYHMKLLSLRSTMSMLSARSGQLQRRAEKLKSAKMQYLAQVDTIRKSEQALDQTIAARIAVPQRTTLGTNSSGTSTSSRSGSPRPSPSSTTMKPQSSEPTPAAPSPTEPVVVVSKKIKKKKPKARQAKIAEDDDTERWKPKRSGTPS